MAEKIVTKHPLGKTGRTLEKEKYDVVKEALVASLRRQELTHTELMQALAIKLKRGFEGNVNWYGETVKLDLEARRVIARTATKPQKYRLS